MFNVLLSFGNKVKSVCILQWKRIRHKFRLLILFFLSLAIITGCQSSSNLSNEVTKLTFWHGLNPPPNRDIVNKLIDKFNQTHPNIFVESLYVGQQDQQMPKILAAVVGNAPPDLLWYNPTIGGQLVELDALIALDDQLEKSPIKPEIDPSLFESMAYKGKIWSIPFATNNVGIFYRPSLFAAAGIEKLPTTWAEFRDTAKKLTRDTNGDGTIDQHGMFLPLGKGEFTVFTWLPFMWSGGGELFPENDSTAASVQLANNQGAIAGLKFWRSLIDDGSVELSGPERGYETDAFVGGKVAMQLSGPWTLGQMQSQGIDFGVLPIPTDEKPATSIGGENLYLFKTTPARQKAAFTFAEYTASQEFQTELALGTGYLPINLQARKNPKYIEFTQKQPAVKVFLDQAQHGRSRPIFPGYNRISENIGRAVESVILGKSTAEQALQASQQRLDLIFD